MTEADPILIENMDDNSLLPAAPSVPSARVAEVAAQLNLCEYGEEGSSELWATMKAEGLVAVFGASDDNMEFRGAIDDELSAYDGAEAYVTAEGLFTPCDDDCKYSRAAQKAAVQIDALWDAGDGEPPWTYETDIPHVSFNVMEDGEVYCRGIVFALSDIAQAQQVTHD